MQSKAATVDQYLAELPDDRKEIMNDLRYVILKNLPNGFEEVMGYGMIGYVIPHSLYPAGYHCDPKLPLPFINLASQKNFIAIHHMGIYANEDLLRWFKEGFADVSKKKLDMGKACIRFKKPEDVPLDLIGRLAARITPEQWIGWYEGVLKNNRGKS